MAIVKESSQPCQMTFMSMVSQCFQLISIIAKIKMIDKISLTVHGSYFYKLIVFTTYKTGSFKTVNVPHCNVDLLEWVNMWSLITDVASLSNPFYIDISKMILTFDFKSLKSQENFPFECCSDIDYFSLNDSYES